MTPDAFRDLARSLPDIMITNHLGAGEVRFRNITIGTIGFPDPGLVTLRVSPDDQAWLIARDTAFFKEAGGAGIRGAIGVRLELVDAKTLMAALEAACSFVLMREHVAPSEPRGIS